MNDTIVALVATPWILPVLLIACIVDGFFPPVPSELVLVAVATVAWTTGTPHIALVIGVEAVGAWLGDTIAYLIGRRAGMTPFGWMRRPAIARIAARASEHLASRPATILLTGRFLPVGRVVINLAAGATRLPFRTYLPLSLLSAVVWVSVSVVVAATVGTMLRADPLVCAIVAVGIAGAGGWLVDRSISAARRRFARAARP